MKPRKFLNCGTNGNNCNGSVAVAKSEKPKENTYNGQQPYDK